VELRSRQHVAAFFQVSRRRQTDQGPRSAAIFRFPGTMIRLGSNIHSAI